MGFFDKIKQGFKKTSDAVSHSLDSVFAAFVKIDEDLLEELEEALILSDVGASTSAKIVAEVEKRAKLRKTTTASELRDLLRDELGFGGFVVTDYGTIGEVFVKGGQTVRVFSENNSYFCPTQLHENTLI